MARRGPGAVDGLVPRHRLQPGRPRPNVARLVLINLAVLAALIAGIELAVRAFLWISRGSATSGLQERTLNLDYEPFVMFGPGWDARFAEVPRDGLPAVLLV